MKRIKAAAGQMEHKAGDKETNFAVIERHAAHAAERGVQVVAFPECCITGYWYLRNLTTPQLDALAESVPGGPSSQRLIALSRRLGVTIGAGLVERGDDGG